MLKAFVHFLGRIQGSHKESGKEIGKSPLSLDMCSQSKDISVRIVHAGGREELYQHAVPASHLMEKYPGMCVARPEVFRNPQESLLWPDENLLPGHKYLLIPSTTAQKLKRKQMEKTKVADYAGSKNEMSDVNITWEAGKDITEESVSSAKEFYTSKGRWSRDSKSSAKRSFRARKPFVPPHPKPRILRGPGWEPSLTSVQELSP
ncbi:uncharacterized protein LOC110629856 [Manihot esculenta]|uniref:Uncharacterized protein n=1 Tax=Manihot esculenta TaxID=3983 RepID=A0A2C9UP98_MANES|nr:uncharacterized protein LOC110629856 [Manihot esculenta]OAY32515.1 hypothetical protein MANES_13G024400v8 [Manihot esculenta]